MRRLTNSLMRKSPRKAQPVQQIVSEDSEKAPPPPEPIAAAAPAASVRPPCYALSDDDYRSWQRAETACRQNPNSQEALSDLQGNTKLLNWRSPVTGQTLLHTMVSSGASEPALQHAVSLGCERMIANIAGEIPGDMAVRKGRHSECLGTSAPARRPSFEQSYRGRQSYGRARQRGSLSPGLEMQAVQEPAMEAESSSAAGYQTRSNEKRKAGVKLQKNQTSKVPKARLDLDLDFQQEEDLDAERLEETIKSAYGGRATVTIDEVADEDEAGRRRSRRSEGTRRQKVKCRVMFDNTEEAKTWQQRGTATREVQSSISAALKLDSSAVEFDGEAKVAEVDAITLKLDSDSSHILCGACLLYNGQGDCEKIVHYSDRIFAGGAVRHSGDTTVDGKSVHTISIIQSKIPDEVKQIYFTLCSCGPEDLSGFKNPSIMLFDNNQPDANLLEYSINQAAKSLSCVMARMLRKPSWSQGDRAMIARLLRHLKLPLLCIDLVMALGAEDTWAVQALGTEEWNLTAKICRNYDSSKELIERHIQGSSSSSVPAPALRNSSGASAPVSSRRRSGGTPVSEPSSSSGAPAPMPSRRRSGGTPVSRQRRVGA